MTVQIVVPQALVDGATLVSKAIADGTTEQAGAAFTQSWTMRNSGTSTWTTGTYGYTLNFESGSRMGATTTYVTLANPVAPGSTVTISVPLTAPTTPGSYTATWRMHAAATSGTGTPFGDAMTVQIVVPQTLTPTITYLNSSSPTASEGAPVTFTIYEYAGPTLSPPGAVSLFDGGTLLATVPLNIPASGQTYAIWTTSSLAAGTHNISAVYNGNSEFQGSSASITEVITSVQVPTTTYLYSTAPTASVGSPVTFQIYEYAGPTLSPPGAVSLFDGSTLLATVSLNIPSIGQSYVFWTTSSLAAGTHNISAVYNGNSEFQGSSASITEAITSVADNGGPSGGSDRLYARQRFALQFKWTLVPRRASG